MRPFEQFGAEKKQISTSAHWGKSIDSSGLIKIDEPLAYLAGVVCESESQFLPC